MGADSQGQLLILSEIKLKSIMTFFVVSTGSSVGGGNDQHSRQLRTIERQIYVETLRFEQEKLRLFRENAGMLHIFLSVFASDYTKSFLLGSLIWLAPCSAEIFRHLSLKNAPMLEILDSFINLAHDISKSVKNVG